MKKLLSLILCLPLLTVILAACGDDQKPEDSEANRITIPLYE